MGPLDTFAPGLFAGQTVVVTGGGRGIGRATALGFAALGADVVIASRTEAELDETATDVRALGVSCTPVVTNIRDLDAVDRLRDATGDRVDVLVNNAGGQFLAAPLDISDNGWRSVVDLNLNGTWNVCSRFMPAMVERGSGRIVNVVHAFVGERGSPLFVHSGAARAGVVNMTRSLAPHLEQHGVTVNAVAPGTTVHERAAANYGWTEQEWRDMHPKNRCLDPDDVAAAIVFLASPAGRMCNGTILSIDAAFSQVNWTILDDVLP
ncbi:MAG TPA: SDR family oxidoreductase [Acidimicrobiales bacterium]|nr:SDR family oxidoreductase [Acidimicrobiales bacterium]